MHVLEQNSRWCQAWNGWQSHSGRGICSLMTGTTETVFQLSSCWWFVHQRSISVRYAWSFHCPRYVSQPWSSSKRKLFVISDSEVQGQTVLLQSGVQFRYRFYFVPSYKQLTTRFSTKLKIQVSSLEDKSNWAVSTTGWMPVCTKTIGCCRLFRPFIWLPAALDCWRGDEDLYWIGRSSYFDFCTRVVYS